MRHTLALTLAASLTFTVACGLPEGPPNLDLISVYGFQQGTWDVSPIDPFVCGHYLFELENNDDRTYHFTRMFPMDTVALLEGGEYPAPYLWSSMEVVEEFGVGELILEPEERQDPMLQLCVDAAPLFGRKAPGGQGFCMAEYDPTTGDYTGATGAMGLNIEGLIGMEGFDEYGYEFGPRGPTPQWLGINVNCVP